MTHSQFRPAPIAEADSADAFRNSLERAHAEEWGYRRSGWRYHNSRIASAADGGIIGHVAGGTKNHSRGSRRGVMLPNQRHS